jgi:Ca2+-binding EF-hand superfamily protein
MEKQLYSSRCFPKDDDHLHGTAYQKWLHRRSKTSKQVEKAKLHDWRVCDFDDHFNACDKGGKGYLNSKEQRKFLTETGITMMKTFEIVKQDKYMTLEQICSLIEHMLPQEQVTRRVQKLFEYYDRQESNDGRLTGFVHEETVLQCLSDHGVDEDDLYIFISPFKRNDNKIEYHRVIEQLFPQNLVPKVGKDETKSSPR